MEHVDRAGQRDGSLEVFAVIEAVMSRSGGGWGVRELAENLGASRSTVNRILARLVEERLLSRDASGAYIVGPRLRILSRTLHAQHPLFAEGTKVLAELSKSTGATALLAISSPDPAECFVLVSQEPDTPVRYTLKAGTLLPTHAGALGLAILSRRGTEGLPENPKKYTSDSLGTRSGIEEALRAASSLGAVVSIGQHIPDAAGIAVPLTVTESIIGSISLSRPRTDFRESDILPSVELLRTVSARLEAAMMPKTTPQDVNEPPAPLSSTLIERISRLLTELCVRPTAEFGINRLAAIVGARSVASRKLAESACEIGLMTKRGPRTWSAGPTLLRWAALLGATTSLPELVEDDLRDLSAEVGETVALALLDPGAKIARIAATQSPGRGVRYVFETGAEIPLHAGAAGKAILAYLPGTKANDAVQRGTQAKAEQEALWADLAHIRSHGWAAADDERVPDVRGMAAPIFVDDQVIGSVTVSFPRYRLAESSIDDLVQAVTLTAQKVTRLLTTKTATGASSRSGTSGDRESGFIPVDLASVG